MKAWAGRRVAAIVRLVLNEKGRACHLCGDGGADSADHDPPRQDLIDQGVRDPDALEFLFPAHLICNKRRQRRPITDALRDELRRRRRADIDRMNATSAQSPALARRRPNFLRAAHPAGRNSFRPLPPTHQEKTRGPR